MCSQKEFGSAPTFTAYFVAMAKSNLPAQQAESTTSSNALLTVPLLGLALVFYSSLQINHFDLFGLRQVRLYFRGKRYTPLPFQVNRLY